MASKMNIPIFIPHIGCPNDCVFCNQRRISGQHTLQTEKQVRQTIEVALDTRELRETEIAFFGGSFTGLNDDLQRFYLNIAKEYIDKYKLKGIRMSTRPDYINPHIIELLKEFPVTAIELGVQSLDERVLSLSKRNHSVEDVYQAVAHIKSGGYELGLQMMLGLPGDTYEKSMNTGRLLVDLKPDTIRIYPTLVIEETELNDWYQKGDYKPLSLEEAVYLTSEILPLFKKAGVSVLRIGLQDNKDLQDGSYIAGPYHPAFKELVEDLIVYKQIKKIINNYEETGNTVNTSKYEIHCGIKIYNRLIGHKKENLKRFSKDLISVMYNKELPISNIHIFTVHGSTVFTGVL